MVRFCEKRIRQERIDSKLDCFNLCREGIPLPFTKATASGGECLDSAFVPHVLSLPVSNHLNRDNFLMISSGVDFHE